ncbi:MAG: twin-arginine translocase subunit TatC [Gammaproteobacteria bacterium]|nr:twin-arginine translocase subunit TatC [Gammaproteobacteria bacterium]
MSQKRLHSYPSPPEQPFTSHLIELRNRLLRLLAVVAVIFLVLVPFANDLYSLIAQPLLKSLPAGGTMIATEVISPFLIPFKFAFMAAVFLAMPYALHQLWGFVAPALYQRERRLMLPLLVSSVLLFYAGMAFAYFVVFPMVFGFITSAAPTGVAVMTDIGKYLDFVLIMFFSFGMAFEVPIATILVVWAGLVTPEQLTGARRYVIVGAFIVGMLLTPPDVISQTMMAIPMWLLFEVGVFFSRFFLRAAQTSHEESEAAVSQGDASAGNEPR